MKDTKFKGGHANQCTQQEVEKKLAANRRVNTKMQFERNPVECIPPQEDEEISQQRKLLSY